MNEGLILWGLQVVFAAAISALFKYAMDLRKEDREERRKMWKEIGENKSRSLLNAARGDEHTRSIEKISDKLDSLGDKIDTRISEIPVRIVELLNARRGGN